MIELSAHERRALRARAHPLRPVVIVGQNGLTPAVVHEVDVALRAHELVKIRVHDDDREARERMLQSICEALAAAPVQHLGKLLIVYRPKPASQTPAKAATGRSSTRAGGPTSALAPEATRRRRRGTAASSAPRTGSRNRPTMRRGRKNP